MDSLIIEMLIVVILFQFPLWRVFNRAGINPYLSLSLLIPGFGFLIAFAILAFSKWEIKTNKVEG